MVDSMEYNKQYRNSKQRQRLLNLLQGTKTHPTADWLYENLRKEFPNISLGTVYRNLGVLEEQGLIMRLQHGSAFDRFDANVSNHPHFYCQSCGRVYDIDIEEDWDINKYKKHHDGHEIRGCVRKYYGICHECKKSN